MNFSLQFLCPYRLCNMQNRTPHRYIVVSDIRSPLYSLAALVSSCYIFAQVSETVYFLHGTFCCFQSLLVFNVLFNNYVKDETR